MFVYVVVVVDVAAASLDHMKIHPIFCSDVQLQRTIAARYIGSLIVPKLCYHNDGFDDGIDHRVGCLLGLFSGRLHENASSSCHALKSKKIYIEKLGPDIELGLRTACCPDAAPLQPQPEDRSLAARNSGCKGVEGEISSLGQCR